jgi:tRNA pseudouridine(38-40) synthase
LIFIRKNRSKIELKERSYNSAYHPRFSDNLSHSHTLKKYYFSSSSSDNPYEMCALTIVGKAYLWHQIRCIVAVLFRVGSGLESPDVINELVSSWI